MIVTITIKSDTGPRSYTGHVICRGPRSMDMLLTEPFSVAGRTVQFPLDSVLSEEGHGSSKTVIAAGLSH